MKIKKIEKKCLWCKDGNIKGKALKYCSKDCEVKHRSMNHFLDWYYGIVKIKKDYKIIRGYLELMYGHRCSECGITHWLGHEIVFDVDHINGDSSDDSKENVRLLCRNCHSQTETYADSKSKKGRFSLSKKGGRSGKD